MNQMINVEELNNIISKMQSYKPVEAIKVTTRFYDYLDLMTRLSPYYIAPPIKPRASDSAYLQGIPVIIDDEIEGHYKFVY